MERIASLAIAAPRRIIALAVLVMVGAAIFGIPVTKSLSNGGFQDPTSESWHASRLLADEFGLGDQQMILAVTTDAGAHSEAARAVGTDLVAQLKRLPFVTGLQSAWTAPPQAEATLVSQDGKTGLIVAGITGGETRAQEHAKQVSDLLPHVDGVTVSAGGEVMSYAQIIDQTNNDLLVMEAIAVPLSFVLLVWVSAACWRQRYRWRSACSRSSARWP
jgi:RND superfamily putative drug exporter